MAADVASFGLNIPLTPAEIALATVTGAVIGDVLSDFVNNVSSALDNIYNATDNGKNEKHGDKGRALDKTQQQIDELERQLQSATGVEKLKIAQKIKNIKKIAQKKRKGEEHSRGCKR